MSHRVLIIDDDPATCELLAAELSETGMEVETCTSGDEALRSIERGSFDAVATDLNMAGMSGLDLCQRLAASRPELPVIVITAFGSVQTAVEAMRCGAYDFITKPFDTDVLELALRRAVERSSLAREVRRLREAVAQAEGFGDLIGESRPMRELYATLDKVADTGTSVLITGETGSGKELVARGLHDRSRRARAPFVALNCAAVPHQLLESELFGHARGAFTDAKSSHDGLFLQANSGTVFLDEIAELPLELQPKLLRALQERSVRPVGGTSDSSFDVRVIAATNRNLDEAVDRGEFRRDLLFRLNVIQIELPPLRRRGNDVLLLAQHFVDVFSAKLDRDVRGLTREAAGSLLAYDWPGNVRELQNVIERAVALAEQDEITADDLPAKLRGIRAVFVEDGEPDSELLPLDEVERRHVARVIAAAGGNKARAARILGVDRKTLYRKLEKHGLLNRD